MTRLEAYQALSILITATKALANAQTEYDRAQAVVYNILHNAFPSDPTPDRGVYCLNEGDVGEHFLRLFGRVWPVSNFMGRILPHDVGKLVYLTDGILQVESDEQRNARQERMARRSQ